MNLREQLGKYGRRNIWIGTSSWIYEGWLGQIYAPERYTMRGRFSKKRFEQECLPEYAETFPIVCGDFAFYQFPTPEFWKRLFATSPQGLRFSFKVPEEVTAPAFPSHPRYGARGGTANPFFLSRSLFEEMSLAPLAPYAIERLFSFLSSVQSVALSSMPLSLQSASQRSWRGCRANSVMPPKYGIRSFSSIASISKCSGTMEPRTS